MRQNIREYKGKSKPAKVKFYVSSSNGEILLYC